MKKYVVITKQYFDDGTVYADSEEEAIQKAKECGIPEDIIVGVMEVVA